MAPPITCDCGTCAKCKHRVYMRDYYRRNAVRVRASAAASRARRLARVQEYDRERSKSRVRNPEKVRAQNAVNNAVAHGRLVRQPCEVCGSPNSEGHHDDYAKPLDVRWVCRTHHMALHRKVAA